MTPKLVELQEFHQPTVSQMIRSLSLKIMIWALIVFISTRLTYGPIIEEAELVATVLSTVELFGF